MTTTAARIAPRFGTLVRTQELTRKTEDNTLALRGLKPGLYTVLVQIGDEAPRRATLVVEF